MTSAAREGDAEPGNTSHRLLLAIDKPNVLLFLADDLGVGDVNSGYVNKSGGEHDDGEHTNHAYGGGPAYATGN